MNIQSIVRGERRKNSTSKGMFASIDLRKVGSETDVSKRLRQNGNERKRGERRIKERKLKRREFERERI